jgi:hypothetical protein
MKSEHIEQREFVSWFRKTYDPVRILAIPNGGARSRSVGAKLKVEGVSPGVPDLYIPEWRMWVEMKTADGGKVSTVQRSWLDYLVSIGDCVIVAHGCEDARRKILESD